MAVTVGQTDDVGIIDRVVFNQVVMPRTAGAFAGGAGTDRLTALEPLDDISHEGIIRLKHLEGRAIPNWLISAGS